MKLLWLGQSGLLFDFDGFKIMIDPYLTDSLAKQDSEFSRKTKINKKLYKSKPDIIILTNCHLDHADDASIEKLLKNIGEKRSTTILSCESVYDYITTIPSMSFANHIMLEEYSEWTVGDINIQAVPAKTDDKTAIGIVITDFSSGKKYYIAGDTLYNKRVIENLPKDIYAAFLPINGEFSSMNVTDAKRFAEKIQPRFCVPVHFGMFDKINPNLFDLPNAIIPKAYKVICFEDYEAPKNEAEEINNIEDTPLIESDTVTDDFEKNESFNDGCLSDNDAVENAVDSVVDDEVSDIDNDVIDDIIDDTVKSVDEVVDEAGEVNEADEAAEDYFDDTIDDIIVDTVDDVNDDIADNMVDEVANDVDDDTSDDMVNNVTDDKATTVREKLDDSDKIDAYIREIEKFERGETTDFSKIDK